MIVDSLTELIGNTPLLRLNRLAGGLGAEILAKLEMFNPYSLKDRLPANCRQKGRYVL